MAVFYVTALEGAQAVVSAAIKAKILGGVYTLAPDKWFIRSESITAKDLSDKLQLPASMPGDGFIVVKISGYYGIAQPDLWEWLAAPIPPPPPLPKTDA